MAASEGDEIFTDIQEDIRVRVAAGFDSPEEILECVIEMYEGEIELDAVRANIEQLIRELIEHHEAEQIHWPEVTDCDRLDAAFAELNLSGIVSHQDFSCCTTCATVEIRDEMKAERQAGRDVRGFAFYHGQDTESAVDGDGLFLGYGAVSDDDDEWIRIGDEICETLGRHELQVSWDRDSTERIFVSLEWKRRRRTEAV